MRNIGLLCSLGMLLAVGCNKSTEGAYENVLFTPRDCGAWNTGCDFEDSIGVGGLINVQIQGIDGFPTAGVTLASDDLEVLDVSAVADIGGSPAWQLLGVGEGVARLEAYDSNQELVDFLEVGVQALTGLMLDDFLGNAVATTAEAPYNEAWTVQAGEDTSFYVVPAIGAGVRTMGRYSYDAFLDADMSDGLLTSADVGEGYLAFNVPAGDYDVAFETISDGTVALDVLITAAAP